MYYGKSLNFRHYTALGLAPSGSYYYFINAKVSQMNFKYYSKSKDAYILFYELESLGNIQSKTSTLIETSTSSCEPSVIDIFQTSAMAVKFKSIVKIFKKTLNIKYRNPMY